MGLLCQNQKESTVFCSESSSVQKPARKVKPVCQVKADIVYSIQKNGIKYGCKICLPHRVFANYMSMYLHFSQGESTIAASTFPIIKETASFASDMS